MHYAWLLRVTFHPLPPPPLPAALHVQLPEEDDARSPRKPEPLRVPLLIRRSPVLAPRSSPGRGGAEGTGQGVCQQEKVGKKPLGRQDKETPDEH